MTNRQTAHLFELIFISVFCMVTVSSLGVQSIEGRYGNEIEAAVLEPQVTMPVAPTYAPTVMPTIAPTLVPIFAVTPSPTILVLPTFKPVPTLAPLQPTIAPTPIPASPRPTSEPTKNPPPAASLNSLMEAVNAFRAANGKGSLTTRADVCAFAAERLNEISDSFNHDGFQRRLNDGSFASLSYTRMAENIFAGSNSPDAAVQAWKDSQGHRDNMLGDFASGCGAQGSDKAIFLFVN